MSAIPVKHCSYRSYSDKIKIAPREYLDLEENKGTGQGEQTPTKAGSANSEKSQSKVTEAACDTPTQEQLIQNDQLESLGMEIPKPTCPGSSWSPKTLQAQFENFFKVLESGSKQVYSTSDRFSDFLDDYRCSIILHEKNVPSAWNDESARPHLLTGIPSFAGARTYLSVRVVNGTKHHLNLWWSGSPKEGLVKIETLSPRYKYGFRIGEFSILHLDSVQWSSPGLPIATWIPFRIPNGKTMLQLKIFDDPKGGVSPIISVSPINPTDYVGDIIQVENKYVERRIERFVVHIEVDLLNDVKLCPEVISCLHKDLKRIRELVPPATFHVVNKVHFWVNSKLVFGPRMAPIAHEVPIYHSDLGTLMENGNQVRKYRSVEISNAAKYLEYRQWQPLFLLHELAHAYHDFLSHDLPDVLKTYQRAMKAKLYHSVPCVPEIGPSPRRAYAAMNHAEYFAELTEAYFGQCDYFPYNRDELEEYDYDGYTLVNTLWNLTRTKILHYHYRKDNLQGEHFPPPKHNPERRFFWPKDKVLAQMCDKQFEERSGKGRLKDSQVTRKRKAKRQQKKGTISFKRIMSRRNRRAHG